MRRKTVRFGITADAHLMGRNTPGNEANFKRFVDAMIQWRPDFAIDLGDFACHVGGGENYITLAATDWHGSYAKVTISDKLRIERFARQRSYVIPLSAKLLRTGVSGE